MKKFVLILAGLMVCTATFAQGLTILHLNDTHSHLDPLPTGEAGVLERTAFIDSVRNADGEDNVLLLHAGDFSQGSSYFTLLAGDLEISLINAMKYDCVTLGNHEFDNGLEELGRRMSMLQGTKVVCANYDFSSFEAGKYVKPYTILEKAGRKIGIIGALCNISTVVSKQTADRVPHFDTADSVNKWADKLKNEEHCDLVIVLSHLGYKGERGVNDTDLVGLVRNVDIIVGGHSHTFLDSIDVSHKDLDEKTVPIVQDGCWGYDVGVIHIR